MEPFTYPNTPHVRRHGPRGYSDYQSFQPWLRDEFTFRCVYCLTRERWHKGKYGFQVDHVIPKGKSSLHAVDYNNLVYACETCNEMKSDADGFRGPCETAYRECLQVQEDGTIVALNPEGQVLIQVLRLDNAENTQFRRLMLEVISLAHEKDAAMHSRLMGFPDDLPDLARRRPPGGNSRPEGIRESCHARRIRKELPDTY